MTCLLLNLYVERMRTYGRITLTQDICTNYALIYIYITHVRYDGKTLNFIYLDLRENLFTFNELKYCFTSSSFREIWRTDQPTKKPTDRHWDSRASNKTRRDILTESSDRRKINT